MASPLISASKTIKASPDRVWSAVSDLAAMDRRSPQCRRMEVLGKGSGPHVGSITLNINRRGILFWPTWSVITEWTPGSLLEFRIPINGAHWRYELKDNGDGSTTLTESRIVKGDTSVVSRVLVATALGGNETFENELRRGIRRTLDSIADDATRS